MKEWWQESRKRKSFIALIFLVKLLVVLLCYYGMPAKSDCESERVQLNRSVPRDTAVFELMDKETDIQTFLPCSEGRIYPPPDFPCSLEGRVGLYVEDLGLLVCGGTDRRAHDSRICWTMSFSTFEWKPFQHSLNLNRIGSHILLKDRQIIIKGGESSETDCEFSYEKLDLDHLGLGWKLECLEQSYYKTEDLCFGSNTVIFSVPCQS